MTEYSVEEFLDLEKAVWETMKSGDLEAQADLLADNFLGVCETGFAGKSKHCSELAAGPIVADYEISQARIMLLSEGMVLLSYLAISRSLKKGVVGKAGGMYISSIWQRFDGGWKNIFSQDTNQQA